MPTAAGGHLTLPVRGSNGEMEDPAAAALLAADGRPPASRAELAAQARWIAARLGELGIARDQVVAVALPNGPEMAAAFLGVASAAVCAPVNPGATAAEAGFLLDDTHAVALVTLAGHETPAHAAAAERGLLRLELQPGAIAGIARDGDAPEPPTPRPDDVALVLHTSGTTSRPKLVPLTHGNLAASAASIAATLGLTAADRCLNVMPLFHIHGLVAGLLASLWAGGSVVCTPGFEGEEFAGWLDSLEPTWYTAVPTIHHEAIAAAAGSSSTSLRFIRSSSAPLAPRLLRELEEAFGVPVVEAYGMTEAAHQIASNPLPPGERRPGTVGRAAGPELAVLDETDSVLPPGEEGEVAVRGSSVTPGYATTEANAAAFTDGWFRTGDLGVLDGDGYLTLTGRKKELINRGGEKIAPREVDEALLEHPDVVRAVAFATPHPTLGEDVAAAVVLRPGAASTPDDLRRFVAERLTAHKVPRRIVPVEEIPSGPTGKLQRIGLAEQLGLAQPAGRGARSQATTPTEAALAGIWSLVLGVAGVPVDEDFVALGGDSLRGVRLLAHVASVTGVELPVSSLFDEGSTVAGMARLVDERRGAAAAVTRPEPGTGDGVLSFFQERVWFLDRLDEGVAAYNVPLLLRLGGRLDTGALRSALELLIERHAALRTTVHVDEDGRPLAFVTAPGQVALDAVEVSEEGARAAAAAESARPFDLETGPLYRLRLWRVSPDHHLLLVVQHHLVTDGWSRGIFVDELARAYRALASGEQPQLEPLPLSYADVASWQRRRLAAGELDGQLAWWRERLADLPPPLDLPADRVRPARQSYAGATLDAEVGGATRAGLLALAAAHGVTPFVALLAGFATVLHRLTGRDDLLVGVPTARRNLPESENVVGPFFDTLPVRLNLAGDPTFAELLARVRSAWLGALDHQDVPFERLVEEAHPARDLSRSPLVQVLFQLRNLPERDESFPAELAVSEEPVETGTSKLDLSVDVVDEGSRLALTYEYATALFERSSIERLAARVDQLLAHAVAEPDCRLSDLQLLPDDERRLLLSFGDGGELVDDGGGTLLDRFHAHARAQPDALAVADERQRLTYSELAEHATALAHRLREAGAEPGAAVGVHLPRSVDSVVAVLGVLEAGGAYLPLDRASPAPRLAAMLEDARPALVITDGDASALPRDVRTIELDGAPAEQHAELPRPRLDDPAYLFFTSGSTGRPKGVVGSHRTLVARAWFAWQIAPPDAQEVYAQRTSFTFVDHTWELFGSLGSGAALAIVSDETVLDPQRLVERLAGERVTRLVVVPSLLAVLLETVPDLGERLPSLRVLFVSGEPFPPDVARRSRAALPGVLVVNEFGATEYCASLSAEVVTRDSAGDVPIGRALPGAELAVVSADGTAAPVGVAGELAVGGLARPRGYLGDDDPRPERLVEHPLRPGVQLWRSGDLARWDSDGMLHHLGRIDRQLKIRGMRVEPGEVEAALRSHPDLAEAAVVPIDAAGGTALAAHVAPAAGAHPDHGELRRHVAALLPPHMVPSRFVIVDALPRTASAKVDRDALVARAFEPVGRSRRPEGLEAQFAELFRELLGLPELPGPDDDFFDLGGHSLLAVRLVARIEQRLGLRVPIAELIQAPTPAGLAARESGASNGRRSALVEVCGGDGNVAFFVVPGVWGLPVSASRLAAHLEPRGPVYGFEAIGHREGELPLETIDELARTYADEVERVRGDRRVVLLGMCFGAHVAYEMTRLLGERGVPPDRLVVFDASALAPAPRGWRLATAKLRWAVGGAVFALARRLHRLRSNGSSEDPEQADVLQAGEAAVDDRVVAVRHANSRAWAKYETAPLDADLVLFRTRKYAWQRLGWRPFVRRLQVVSLDVEHAHATNEGAPVTAAAVQAILDDVGRT